MKYNREYDDGILEGPLNIVQVLNGNQKTQDILGNIYFTKQQAVIGISYQDINEQLVDDKKLKVREGAYITDVDKPLKFYDSYKIAWNAGIRQGDVITELNDITIKSVVNLQEQMRNYGLGDNLVIKGFRGDKEKTFKLRLTNVAPLKPRVSLFNIGVSNIDKQRIKKDNPVIDIKTLSFDIKDGVFVHSIPENSKVAKAGIIVGDIITGIDGVKVSNKNEYIKQLLKYHPNDVIIITVYRDGRDREMEVTL